MESIFTLPYSEYKVIEVFSKMFPKSEDYCCFIPASRTNKGIDFILVNQKTGKMKTFQIKGSRSYFDHNKNINNFWYNNFKDKVYSNKPKIGTKKTKTSKKILADYYVLFGIYEDNNKIKQSNIKERNVWKNFVICVPKEKMVELLKNMKQKNDNRKSDKFFSIQLKDNIPNINRGNITGRELSSEYVNIVVGFFDIYYATSSRTGLSTSKPLSRYFRVSRLPHRSGCFNFASSIISLR